jgi:phosphate transport system substrate-binding protein
MFNSYKTRRHTCEFLSGACTAWLAFGTTLAQTAEAPLYVPSRPLSGVIRTWGSPQMGDLLKRYEESFRTYQPGVRFENELHSTITAVAGVYTGRAEIGVLGREIWPIEEQAFESVTGHAPTMVDVATGAYNVPKATFALMIFVHRSNPLASITTEQLERTFGSSEKAIRTWGDLGVKGSWAGHTIHLYGFTTDNDKAMIFRNLVFSKKTHWNCNLREFANGPGADGLDAGELIIQAVAKDPYGIGISNVHYATKEVRAVPLAPSSTAEPIAPSRENVASRVYPLTRAVYFVLDRSADHPLAEATSEFVKYVLSRQAAADVLLEGSYLPLPPELASDERNRLRLDADQTPIASQAEGGRAK